MKEELRAAILKQADKLGIDPVDLATVVSYETAGTFDPWKKGPKTQWGQHRGLIQWGEPQRKKYGVHQGMSIDEQMEAAGKYLYDAGVRPGMGILDVYSAINAGRVGLYNRSDANNGGAPGTVRDKVMHQMGGHRKKGAALLGGTYTADIRKSGPGVPSQEGDLGSEYLELPRSPEKEITTPYESPGIWQLQKDAFNVEQTLPWMLDRTDATPDASWALGADRLEADLKERGLPIPQYAERLGSSYSEEHYLENLNKAQLDYDRVKRLSEAGLTGGVLRVANSILDPVALAGDIVGSSVAAPLVFTNRATRTARVLQGAFTAAAGGAAGEGVAFAVNPHRDTADLLMGTVFGFGVGGAIGALSKAPHTVYEARKLQQIAQQTMGEHEGITAIGRAVGAAEVSAERKFLNDEGFEFLEGDEIAEGAFLGARGDLSAMLQKSNNPVVKSLAGLVQDGTGKKGGAINAISASEERTRLRQEWVSALHRSYNPGLAKWYQENGTNYLQRGEAEAEFNRQIDSYIRDRGLDRADRYNQSVIETGNKIAKLQADILELAQNPFKREGLVGRAVRGFEYVQKSLNYLTRYWDPERVIAAKQQYGEGTIHELIEGSIRSANPTMDEDLLKKLAKGFTKGIVNRAHGLDDIAVRALGSQDIDELAKELSLSANDAANLKAFFDKGSTKDAGRDARAKRRVLMDEAFSIQNPIMVKTGVRSDKPLSLDDLIVKDAMATATRYADQMAGMIAMARFRVKDPVTGDLLIDGITSDGEFQTVLNLARKRGADEIAKGTMTKDQVDQDIKRLEFAYSHIRGRPVSDAERGNFGLWSRLIRKFNFSRIMNQVGFAQVAEVGVVVGHLGVKASFSQVPALRRLVNTDGETILKSGLANDLEAWIGIGTDRLRATTDYRMDDFSGNLELAPAGKLRKAEALLNKGNRLTSEISGMTQANIMLDRWAAASIVQKFANMAQKGGKGMSKERLADLGLDEAMNNRIMKMFNEEGNFEYTKGLVSGRKVARMHIDRWSDKEAAEAFRNATFRYANQLIQKNDIGNLMMWMSHPAAKMLMQFRTFMVGAYGKQTLKALHMRDFPAFMSMVMSMAVAGAVYTAQTQIQAIGREDRNEFLKDRLSFQKIGAAAFARSGASSVVPMLIDTGLYGTRNEGLFTHTRTTGQVSNMLFGNPTTGGLDDLTQALRAGSGLMEGREWSGEEARAMTRILPFGNAIPMVMGLNSLINASNMPKYAPRD